MRRYPQDGYNFEENRRLERPRSPRGRIPNGRGSYPQRIPPDGQVNSPIYNNCVPGRNPRPKMIYGRPPGNKNDQRHLNFCYPVDGCTNTEPYFYVPVIYIAQPMTPEEISQENYYARSPPQLLPHSSPYKPLLQRNMVLSAPMPQNIPYMDFYDDVNNLYNPYNRIYNPAPGYNNEPLSENPDRANPYVYFNQRFESRPSSVMNVDKTFFRNNFGANPQDPTRSDLPVKQNPPKMKDGPNCVRKIMTCASQTVLDHQQEQTSIDSQQDQTIPTLEDRLECRSTQTSPSEDKPPLIHSGTQTKANKQKSGLFSCYSSKYSGDEAGVLDESSLDVYKPVSGKEEKSETKNTEDDDMPFFPTLGNLHIVNSTPVNSADKETPPPTSSNSALDTIGGNLETTAEQKEC